MEHKKPNLNSVEKALAILLSFKPDHPTWGVREMSAHLGFSPATVQRILQTLKNQGFVEQDEQTRHYRLGTIYYEFIHTLQTDMSITRFSLPFMQKLWASTQETVHLNIIQNGDRVCIDHIESPMELKATMPIGNRSPLYAGASSKCLLAFSTQEYIDAYLKNITFTALTRHTIVDKQALAEALAVIREQGYAESLAERSMGLGSLSAPVLDHKGLILAAISLAVPEIRYKNEKHRRFCVAELQMAARQCSERMGWRS